MINSLVLSIFGHMFKNNWTRKNRVSCANLHNLLKCLNYTKEGKSSRNDISISNKGFKRKNLNYKITKVEQVGLILSEVRFNE